MQSVLVIDFLSENLSIIEKILKPKFNILRARSVEGALEIIADSKPDVLLINYVIPGSSGVEVLEKILVAENGFLTLMMSNAKDIEIISDAILHGFDGFIKIPVELKKFEAQLKKAKEIHKMRRDAGNYLKVKATKAMSITFAHYTRNLLTPLIGYMPHIKSDISDNIYNIFEKNLNRINKLTYKLDDLLEKGELVEYSYTDGSKFYDIDFDDD
jgi:DNA-binding NtrC family response regulator